MFEFLEKGTVSFNNQFQKFDNKNILSSFQNADHIFITFLSAINCNTNMHGLLFEFNFIDM
jgi:hypothetical protein